jgi:hypothetical protein
VNRFEIAILRIVFKNQNPISISRIIEGFPSGSEGSVLEAVSNLFELGYVFYLDPEKLGKVTYNKAKRGEILKIIDPPLFELREPKAEVDQAASSKVKEDVRQAASTNKVKPMRQASQIGLLISSALLFSIITIFSTTPVTENIFLNSELLDSNYNYSHPSSPMFGFHDSKMYPHTAGDFIPYDPHYFDTGGNALNSSLVLARTDARSCHQMSSF